jgi:hypothetical protein
MDALAPHSQHLHLTRRQWSSYDIHEAFEVIKCSFLVESLLEPGSLGRETVQAMLECTGVKARVAEVLQELLVPAECLPGAFATGWTYRHLTARLVCTSRVRCHVQDIGPGLWEPWPVSIRPSGCGAFSVGFSGSSTTFWGLASCQWVMAIRGRSRIGSRLS